MPNDMTGKVQTVLGTIGPEELGPTTTHEHLLIDFRCMFTPPSEASDFPKAYGPVTMQNLAWVRYNIFSNEDNLLVGDVDTAIEEVELFQASRGRHHRRCHDDWDWPRPARPRADRPRHRGQRRDGRRVLRGRHPRGRHGRQDRGLSWRTRWSRRSTKGWARPASRPVSSASWDARGP